MEITGIIKAISPTMQVTDKYKKRDFVLTTEADTKYPQHVSFTASQEKCDLLDKYREGQQVTVHFNLRGREWNGPQGIKYFNTLEAWRIEGEAGSNKVVQAPAPSFAPSTDDSDLPF